MDDEQDADDSNNNSDWSTEAAAAQYLTALPTSLWDPTAFPASAFLDQLNKKYRAARRKAARQKGEPVAFVPAVVHGAPAPPPAPTLALESAYNTPQKGDGVGKKRKAGA